MSQTDQHLLRRTAIDDLAETRKQHFLNSKAVRQQKSLGDLLGLQHLGVHWVRVAPGDETTELHAHHYEEECLYILSGEATAVFGDEQTTVGAGDFLAYPIDGMAHKLINTGSEDLVYLMIGQRLPHDISDYPDARQRLYRNTGQWDLVPFDAIRDPRG